MDRWCLAQFWYLSVVWGHGRVAVAAWNARNQQSVSESCRVSAVRVGNVKEEPGSEPQSPAEASTLPPHSSEFKIEYGGFVSDSYNYNGTCLGFPRQTELIRTHVTPLKETFFIP
ncbi:hypothetical protein RUM44_009612 [Polyplax serrata]|uniref:Uncharacterized protein n=1 Tax=Polyplax serrata TaxID=468196 RepID=A0ABR1AT64_POLSC